MRKFIMCLPSLLFVTLVGCPTAVTPTTTSGGGWIVETAYFGPDIISLAPGTSLSGAWQSDGPNAAGSAAPWSVLTDSTALGVINNGRVPATWQVNWNFNAEFPQCTGHSTTATPGYPGVVEEINCYEVVLGSATFSFTPNPINLNSPGAVSTIHGSGFSSTYGMPLVQYYDMNGNLIDQMNATSVAADGSSISAAMPNLTGLPAGTYAGIINNVNSSRSYTYLGSLSVTVTNPPPSPCPHQRSCTPT